MTAVLIRWAGSDLDVVNGARTRTDEFVVMAYERGYRVTDEGRVVSPHGRVLSIKRHGSQRYPTVSLRVGTQNTPSGMYGLPAHHLAAYCFFGEQALSSGLKVRHLNGDTEDLSRTNIRLGTGSDNEMDKTPAVRRASAQVARAAQKRPGNYRFTDDEVRSIRARSCDGETGAAIGRSLGVTKECIHLILKGVNYADVR